MGTPEGGWRKKNTLRTLEIGENPAIVEEGLLMLALQNHHQKLNF
jgi:hypothetical protein